MYNKDTINNKCTRNCNALKIELLQILIHLSYGVIYLSYVCCTFSVCIKIIVQLLYKNHTIFFHRDEEIMDNEAKFWKSFLLSINKNKRELDGKQRILSIIVKEFGPKVLHEKLQV